MGRIKTHHVTSEWGKVLDISANGLRILHKGSKPPEDGTETTLTIRSSLAAFTIDVRCSRSTKLGFRRWQLGIEILDADENARRELSILARAAIQGVSTDD
jgi:hypothetical protein